MRRLYTLLLALALPGMVLVWLWGCVRRGEGWRELSWRLGAGPAAPAAGVWVHAVSVGEVQAAAMLIGALRARAPQRPITLTCATPTGRARARALLPGIDVRYAPYDLPGCVRRCLERLQPALLLIIETELWPNLLHEAARRGVPTLLASARVSARSARRYARVPGLLRAAAGANLWVAAQSAPDAERFAALGVPRERLMVAGNLKFDREPPADCADQARRLRERYAPGRQVWVAGSTHEGEERIVLEAHRRVRLRWPEALLVLAPRHPQRFEAAAAVVSAVGLSCARRSAGRRDGAARGSPPAEAVLLLDTLGELECFFAAADVAFVGGSLVGVGGHNLLEPAALGLPVLAGPQQFNAPEVAQLLARYGGLTLVHDAQELATAVSALLSDERARRAQGAAALAAVQAHRGALARVLELADSLTRLPAGGPLRPSSSEAQTAQ